MPQPGGAAGTCRSPPADHHHRPQFSSHRFFHHHGSLIVRICRHRGYGYLYWGAGSGFAPYVRRILVRITFVSSPSPVIGSMVPRCAPFSTGILSSAKIELGNLPCQGTIKSPKLVCCHRCCHHRPPSPTPWKKGGGVCGCRRFSPLE